jgi:O-antigen/teichoic acid export membrane protein
MTTPDMLRTNNDTHDAFMAALREEEREEIRTTRERSKSTVQIAFAIMALVGVVAGLVMHTFAQTLGLTAKTGDEIAWGFAIMSGVYIAAMWAWNAWADWNARRHEGA